MNYFKIAFLLVFLSVLQLNAQNEQGIFRYPNTSKKEVTFSYAGDIYVAPIGGGTARKLTSHSGTELFPRFSPDGSKISFTGEYDGNNEIYLIASTGGSPKRLTYTMDMPDISERQGPSKIIMQWSRDGKEILYRSRHESWNVLSGRLYKVDENASLPKVLPLFKAGFSSLSPDESKIAFNRIFREYRTWKRYRGGQADDIYIYDFKTKSLENITNNPAQDIIPMWAGDKIYFLSDREKTMNLFVYNLITKQTKRVTNFTEYDVKFPSLGAEHISFENGGEIYTLKIENDYLTKLDIKITDDKLYARPAWVELKNYVNGFDISPDGKYSLMNARGDVLIVPEKNGNIINLTNSSSIHERDATWSPDGKWIAFISDESGKEEVYVMHPDGSSKTRLTDNGISYRWELRWSPDSKKLINSDKAMNVYVIDVETKKSTIIAQSRSWEIRDFSWSPDSRWVAYTDNVNNNMPVLFLHSLETGKTRQITSEFFESGSPVFSGDSKYLFFTSNRTFSPTIGEFEYNFTYNNMSRIYGLTLLADLPSPTVKFEAFPTYSDSVKTETAKADKKSDKKELKEEKKQGKLIDLDGLENRIFDLNVPASNYWGLSFADGKLYYVRTSTGNPPTLFSYNIKTNEEEKITTTGSYAISANGNSILFRSGADFYIEKLKANITPKDGKLDLKDFKTLVSREEEWKQIFNETWRQMKDFFYDSTMHQVDWEAVRVRYEKLLPAVSHRNDLTYILGEMIGELNVGHAYVGGGDKPKVETVEIGALGADFAFDEASGLYRITKILEGRNWEEKTRSPLTEPGINIKAGDYLLEIDGKKLSKDFSPQMALVNKSQKYVRIKFSSTPNGERAQFANIKTIENESELRYFNWVERNRLFVDSATGGKVGYVHIPDMMPTNGLNEFVKYFYPQVRKEALIIDDRYNGGGNVSPIIIERLRRILAVAKNARNQKEVYTTPNAVMTGPMVMLINEQSMSDGDLFPHQFKLMGLGKLIGKRTWGGVIGIRGSLPFLDGGYLNRPEFANFGRDGSWILEGTGISPDIEVDNHPEEEFYGKDAQLLKAIEVILEEMKTDTKPKIPQVPAYPDKK